MIYEIDPLTDRRWTELVAHHGGASVFHTSEWLRAIQDTYGYVPAALTTSGPRKDLNDAVAFCRVDSWLTGRRLVSIPFSDHCEPLVSDNDDLAEILRGMEARAKAERCKYVELRPVTRSIDDTPAWKVAEAFYVHRLKLGVDAAAILPRLHKSCVQRRIRHAINEGIVIDTGRSGCVFEDFYGLMVKTRRRQGLLPHPKRWFLNVLTHLGQNAMIRCAYRQGRPIGAIFTLSFRDVLYYKYAASDRQFHNCGGIPYLIWSAIEDAVKSGIKELDFGRTDYSNTQLAVFKDRWDAARSSLCYWRTPGNAPATSVGKLRKLVSPRAVAHIPNGWLIALGDLCYRHVG